MAPADALLPLAFAYVAPDLQGPLQTPFLDSHQEFLHPTSFAIAHSYPLPLPHALAFLMTFLYGSSQYKLLNPH